MKKKALLLLTGAIALMCAASPVIPGSIKAAIADTAHGHRGGHGLMEQLNLNDTQKSEIRQYRQDGKKQIEGILSDDQKAEIQQARQNHTRPNLNLNDDQKAKIKQIHEETEAKIMGVLTSDQQQKLQELRAARHQQWQQQ